MTRWLSRLVLAGLVTVQVTACKPNENAQRSQWEHNETSVQSVVAHYPRTGKVLQARLTEARAQWDLALKEGDKDKRAEKMQAANALITDLTGGLSSLDHRIERIDKLKADPRLKKLPAGKVLPVFSKADQAVAKARTILNGRPIGTADELKTRTQEANGVLIAAVGPLERLVKQK